MIADPVWSVPWAFAADLVILGIAIYCLSKTVADLRARRFVVGVIGAACSALLLIGFTAIMFAEVSP